MIKLCSTILCGLLLLTGCQSSGGMTRFYLLNAEPGKPVAENPVKSLRLVITNLTIPQYLQRPQIMTRSSKQSMQLAEHHQWAGNLRKNIKRSLAANLAAQLQTTHIALSSGSMPDSLRLEVHILQFERMQTGKISLVAQWILATPDQSVQTEITTLSSDVVIAKDYEAITAEMSRLLGQLSRQIALASLMSSHRKSIPVSGGNE